MQFLIVTTCNYIAHFILSLRVQNYSITAEDFPDSDEEEAGDDTAEKIESKEQPETTESSTSHKTTIPKSQVSRASKVC